MKLYAKIQKIFDMTKLWLGKVGALLRSTLGMSIV